MNENNLKSLLLTNAAMHVIHGEERGGRALTSCICPAQDFLCGVCVLSLCVRATPTSSHSPETCKSGELAPLLSL